MRLGLLTLIAIVIPAVLAAAEPDSPPKNGSPSAAAAEPAMLEKKLAELKALKAEIRQLRKAAADERQLLISVQMLEVSPKRLEGAGEELDFGDIAPEFAIGRDKSTESTASTEPRIKAGMVLDSGQLRQRLKQWSEKAIVRVVAEPKLATVSGRPAQFLVGGMIPVPDGANHRTYQEYGTRVDVVATADEDGSIRLELRARQSGLDSRHEVTVEGQKVPGLVVQEIDTAARLLPEQVLVMGTFVGDRRDVERSPDAPAPDKAKETVGKVAFIVLARVDIIDGMQAVEGTPAELDKETYPEGSDQSETEAAAATAPRGMRREAEFTGLNEKRVAIVCRPHVELKYGAGTVVNDLPERVGQLLRQEGTRIKVVKQMEVNSWTDENPDQGLAELGAAVKADMVLGIDLEEFSLFQGQTLYQGKSQIKLTVWDVSKGNIAWSRPLRKIAWPARGGVPAQDDPVQQFQREYIEVLANEISNHFYPLERFSPDADPDP